MSSFKRISTTIGLVGGLIAAILGGVQLLHQLREARTVRKDVQARLSVGDNFAEQFEFERAIEEYEGALHLDNDNIEAQRRIITAMRQKLWLRYDPLPDVNEVLARIYRLRALHPALKNDSDLLLNEALTLKCGERLDAAVMVLEKAHKLYPNNSEFLAQLGLLTVKSSATEKAKGLDLLRHAAQSMPDEPRYHYYLAKLLDEAKQNAEAIREYYRAAKLATGGNFLHRLIRELALVRQEEVLYRIGDMEGGMLTSRIDMPVSERVQIIEYFVANADLRSRTADHDPYLYLAILYRSLGDLKAAAKTIRAGLPNDKSEWNRWGKLLALYATILQEGGLEPSTLAEVRSILRAGVTEISSSYTMSTRSLANGRWDWD